MPVHLSLDQQALEAIDSVLTYELDGKQLKKDLAVNLRAAVEPALPVIRGELMAMGSAGPGVSPPLRATVLNNLSAKTRFSGDNPGVRVAISRRGMPRGFTDAARRLNRDEGWSHPLWGRPATSVQQIGAPGYFDRPLEERVDEMRDAVVQAVQDMADRIAGRG